jgi:hypothetical protein
MGKRAKNTAERIADKANMSAAVVAGIIFVLTGQLWPALAVLASIGVTTWYFNSGVGKGEIEGKDAGKK